MKCFAWGAAALQLSCSVIALTSVQLAFAQSTSAKSVDQTEASSGEIVVTAQKRSERLLDVPVSVAVASGQALRGLNLNGATDLQYVAPGLGLGDSNTPRGAGFRVRGVGTNVFADGIEQSVGTVLDGVPLARAGQGLADLIDVERIEVLRGPQGMLFGRNASAGVINIVTRRPSDTWSGEGLASYGSDNDVKISGTVSGPVAPVVAVRLTGFYNAQDGFVRNLATGQDLNNRKEYGGRAALLFKPGTGTEITIRGDWSKRDVRSNIWTIRALPSNALRPILAPEIIAAVGPRSRIVNLSGPVYNQVEGWGVSGQIDQQVGDYTLTSVTAYRKWDQSDNNDADQSLLNVLDLNRGTNKLNQFSQELRLTSPADRFISFVAGAFYYNSTNSNLVDQRGKFSVALARAGAAGVTAAGQPPAALGGRELAIRVKVRDLAAFGQATINFTPEFRAILGARYTNTQVGAALDRHLVPGGSASYNALLGSAFAPITYDLSTTDDNFSWRVGLQYQPSRNHNVYATVSRGYKGPGFDTQVDFTLQTGKTSLQSALVNPELATNYEIGYKASVLNRMIDFSIAAYITDFENFQAQIFEVPPGAVLGSYRIRNAGLLRSKGAEFELNLRPSAGLTVGFGVAYNDTKYVRFLGAACPRLGSTVTAPNNGTNCGSAASSFDASGLRAPNAPRWTISANLRYDQPIIEGVDGFVQMNGYLRSDNYFSTYPVNIPNPTQQDGYMIVNGSIGLSFADRRLTASVFAKNLFGEHFVTNIFDLPFGGAGDLGQFTTRDADRTIGVQLGARF